MPTPTPYIAPLNQSQLGSRGMDKVVGGRKVLVHAAVGCGRSRVGICAVGFVIERVALADIFRFFTLFCFSLNKFST